MFSLYKSRQAKMMDAYHQNQKDVVLGYLRTGVNPFPKLAPKIIYNILQHSGSYTNENLERVDRDLEYLAMLAKEDRSKKRSFHDTMVITTQGAKGALYEKHNLYDGFAAFYYLCSDRGIKETAINVMGQHSRSLVRNFQECIIEATEENRILPPDKKMYRSSSSKTEVA